MRMIFSPVRLGEFTNFRRLRAVLCGTLVAVMVAASASAAADIMIGRTLPLTGPFATYGTAKRDGADA